MCCCVGWEGRLWNTLCGLSVSYTVKIHGTIRRSFFLSLLSPSTPNKAKEVIHRVLCHLHIPTLLLYLCSIFKINAYILSVIANLFLSALSLLFQRSPMLMRWSEPNYFQHWWLSHAHRNTPHSREPLLPDPAVAELLLTLKTHFSSWIVFLTHPLLPFTHSNFMLVPCNCMSCTAPGDQLVAVLCCAGGIHESITKPGRHVPELHKHTHHINEVHLITC